jgi:hypothetical protein
MHNCLEVGAFRSAIVMGWNLVYDFVRQWIYDHKLTEFNQAMLSRHSKVVPIVEYSDFFRSTLSEFQVLDLCNPVAIIGGKVTDALKALLRERNDYAHPNFHDPSMYQANYFIEQCLKAVNGSPFI